MDRLACVDVPEWALQDALAGHPEWAALPVVVVDEDKSTGKVLSANKAARTAGISSGLRYAQALSLCRTLRAEPQNVERLKTRALELGRALQRFSPHVEVSEEAGVFFLDASGLDGLYPRLVAYAEEIRAALTQRSLFSSAVVGFNRFFTYAVARASSGNGIHVFQSAASEAQAASRVPVEKLFLSKDAHAFLSKLGIRTAGEFAKLPHTGVKRRFPRDIARVYEMAKGALVVPINKTELRDPISFSLHLDEAVTDQNQLLFFLSPLVDSALKTLAARGEALVHFTAAFTMYRTNEVVQHEFRPAEPTLEARVVISLVRLRLEAVETKAGITGLRLDVMGARAEQAQLAMFQKKPKRDPQQAQRAVASLKALFGDDAVVTAELRSANLSGGRFSWKEAGEIPSAKPSRAGELSLVRRFKNAPDPLPHRPSHEPDGWLLRGIEHGPVSKLSGPYIIAGGWWRKEVHRTFYFAEMEDGAVLWIFYDRGKRRWFLEGELS